MPNHLLLTANATPEEARSRVEHFFEKNFLVRYDRVAISTANIISGDHRDFWPRLEAGLAANRQAVAELLAELRESGFSQLAELAGMKRGYESKVLHILTHQLDGFFGIDSSFYNLEEDAHQVSARLTEAIHESPGSFWLVEAECAANAGHEANQLDQLRTFDVTPE